MTANIELYLKEKRELKEREEALRKEEEILEQKTKANRVIKGDLKEQMKQFEALKDKAEYLGVWEGELKREEAFILEREKRIAEVLRRNQIIVTLPSQIDEWDVYDLYQRWKNYKQVAKKLFMSEKEVRRIVKEKTRHMKANMRMSEGKWNKKQAQRRLNISMRNF